MQFPGFRRVRLQVRARLLITVLALVILPSSPVRAEAEPLFSGLELLLERHLREWPLSGGGLVSVFDYRAAMADARTGALLARQDARLVQFDPAIIDERAEALAFWINAYNYFMLAHLLRNPIDSAPAGSVRDYGSLIDPYALFGRALFSIGNRNYSLREIELDILLGDEFAERGWKDARVHFMVNCASVGCPPLRREVYTAANVECYLAENTRLALATPLQLRVDGTTLEVTSLFEWYANDFAEQSGSVRQFIAEHGGNDARAALLATDTLGFIDYDWALNSPANMRRALDALGPGANAVDAL